MRTSSSPAALSPWVAVIYRPEALVYHDHYLTEQEFSRLRNASARAGDVARIVRTLLNPRGIRLRALRASRAPHQASLVALGSIAATFPFWRTVARRCPVRIEAFAVRLYLLLYHSVLRAHIHRELARGIEVAAPGRTRWPAHRSSRLQRVPFRGRRQQRAQGNDLVSREHGLRSRYSREAAGPAANLAGAVQAGASAIYPPESVSQFDALLGVLQA